VIRPTPQDNPPDEPIEAGRTLLTAREVRRLALALPEAEEHRHFGKASFRVRGRIFATLEPEGTLVLLKLAPDEQNVLGRAQPAVFRHALGAQEGWTGIELRCVDPWLFEELLIGAWRRLAPRRAIARWEANRRVSG
jgi:hypothetical protein